MTKNALLKRGPKIRAWVDPPPIIRAMPERKRFFFNWCLSLSDYSSGRLVGIIFIRVPNRRGVGGESEKTPCSMNVQKFSIVFWLAKEICCKGWLCFVPCLTFPHNQTISAFLYLYNPTQPVAFTLLQPLFLSLTKISTLAGKGTDR